VLVYDFLLTFSDEVEFMWRRGWTLLNIIFFINRYFPFVDAITEVTQSFMPQRANFQFMCKVIYYAHAWQVVLGVNVADLILVLRTYAIWDSDKRIAAGLLAVLFGTTAVEAVYMTRVIRSFVFIKSPSPSQFPGCFPAHYDPTPGGIAYIAMAIFETVVFAVTLLKLFRRREPQHAGTYILFETLYRDGITFYAMVFGITLVNVVILQTVPSETSFIFTLFHRVLHSILSTRLVLNLRRAAASPRGLTAQLDMMPSA